MAQILSADEIDSLLISLSDSPASTTQSAARPTRSRGGSSPIPMGTTLADIGRQNTRRKPSKSPDYLHVTSIQGEAYYSSPGSTVLHPESHARKIYDFDKIRGFIPG